MGKKQKHQIDMTGAPPGTVPMVWVQVLKLYCGDEKAAAKALKDSRQRQHSLNQTAADIVRQRELEYGDSIEEERDEDYRRE